MSAVHDTGGSEDTEGVRVAGNVQLVARRAIEGAASVRSDLRTDSRVSQQRKGATGGSSAPEVEVQCPVSPSSEMQAAGRVEECGELRSLIAGTTRRDPGELFAYVLG